MPFDERVWALIKKIPRGKVATYKQVAIALGKPNAARAVGNACNRSPGMPRVPCHRVVKSDRSIGGYARGTGKKTALLGKEGVLIKNCKVAKFSSVIFRF